MSAARPLPDPAPPVIPPQHWPRVAALFDEAADLPPAQRGAWLDALSQQAPELSPWVAQLLAAHARHETDDFLAGPPLGGPTWQALGGPALAPGQVLGPYRLLHWVATGGMGQVWQAEPVHGPAGQRVALKLPLLHRPDSVAHARFLREAGLLAELSHPHIARLLQAGQAADGLPYLAVEWVDGVDLKAWQSAQPRPLAASLALFLQVLDAVAHAHSRLVIHRDIKPSNILVGAQGAKLLDFGIAKLWQGQAPVHATELTQRAGRVLTPAYAAPEQVRGEPLTPAADVYALGVVLFELLTGERPYRLQFNSAAQMEQAVAAADVRRLGELHLPWPRAQRVDLGAILARALQRDPQARYAGARELADDLRRHLAGQPVLAQPPTAGYLLRKALQRHRVAAGGAAATLAALLLGVLLAGWQAHQATQARDAALAAHARSRATQGFLVDLIDDAGRSGQPLQPEQLMARAEALARKVLPQAPDQLAAVLGLVGQSAQVRGDGARGQQLLAEAAGLARDADLAAELGCQHAFAATRNATPDAALAVLRQQAADPARDAAVRLGCTLSLAQLLVQGGQVAEADTWLWAAQALLRQAGPEAWAQRTWLLTMQLYLGADGRGQGLEARAAAQVAELKALGRERSRSALGLYNTWGTLAQVSGEPERALQRWTLLAEMAAQDDPDRQVAPYHLAMLATAWLALGEPAQAAQVLQQALRAAERSGSDSDRFHALCQLGRVAGLQGDDARAQALYQQALAVPDHGEPLRRNAAPFCAQAQAESALIAGRLPAAAALLQAAGPIDQQRRPLRTGWLALQAELQWRQGDAVAAERSARQGLADAQALQADNLHSARTGMAHWMLALALQAQGRSAEAEQSRSQALTHLRATVRPGHRWLRWAEAG